MSVSNKKSDATGGNRSGIIRLGVLERRTVASPSATTEPALSTYTLPRRARQHVRIGAKYVPRKDDGGRGRQARFAKENEVDERGSRARDVHGKRCRS